MLSRFLVVLVLAIGLLAGARATAAAAPVWVTISSTPPGATIYVDGKEQGAKGIAGDSFRLRLSSGVHRVLLELPGYKPLEQTVQIGRSAQRLAFTLEHAPARLAVRAPATSDDARDSELFIDAEPRGRVPAELELKQGPHLVEVRKPGFKVYSETVELAAAETKTLMVTLRPEIRRGTLLVAASAEGLVYIDGQARGAAPQAVELDEGDHAIEVRASDGGAVLWQQRAKVTAGQQVRVQAEWKVADKTGSLLVIAPDDADLIIDGTQSARPNQPVSGLRVGQHTLLVQGKGYSAVTRVVDIEANKQKIEQVQPAKSDAGRATVRMVMVNPIEGAEYFINGRRVKEDELLGDKGVEVAAGKNILVVQKAGVGKVTRTVNVAAGASEVVTVELKNVGRLAVTSTPAGGQILLDGQPVGTTTFTAEDVPAGQHNVEVRLNGFPPFSQAVTVRGGESAAVQADLQAGTASPPGAAYPAESPYPPSAAYPTGGAVYVQGGPRRLLLRSELNASLSAVTNDPGRFTVDLGTGYPYFVNLGIAVGAARVGMFGLDVGVELRSDIYVTEVGVKLRAQLFQAGPIAGGLNLLVAGGGGPDQRNDFVLEVGAPLTLIAGRFVQLTARPYLQIYSDRACPPAATASPDSLTRGEACSAALSAVATGGQDTTGALERFNGARFLLQGALEFYVARHLNLWLLIEGAPGTQRLAWTRPYNALLFQQVDYGIYGRSGVTFRF